MKKLMIFAACAAILTSCGLQNKKVEEENYVVDSLENILEQKNSEIDDLMGTFNEIQEGFNLINEAQGRINMLRETGEGNTDATNIKENMVFIQQTLKENKEKIEDLQKKLKESSINTSKLTEAIAKFEQQLNEKTAEIETLRAQMEEKDIKIAELDDAVIKLKNENEDVKAQKEQTEQIAKNQDQQLNTAYYMYGTSKELKEHGVLSKGEVLQGNYDKNDFIKIDIRKTTVIPLDSKSADILTSHPAGSYSLLKDSKGEYTLRITDANKFWSASKYLVIKVK